MSKGLVWFRRDLRLDDNPAWSAATTNNTEVVARFVIDPKLWDRCHQRRIDQLSDHLGALDHKLPRPGIRVKHLLIDWRWGEKWFRRMLAGSDTAQNVGNWQWVAGTGADAAPYFRIFNPVSQGRRLNPDGEYVRRWVPELRPLARASIHAPWEATPLDLAAAGVGLGVDYPYPIVDHGFARARCLDAYQAARGIETSG